MRNERLPLLSSSMHIIKTDDINEILHDAKSKNIKTIYLVPESKLITEPLPLSSSQLNPSTPFPSVKPIKFFISLFIALILLLFSAPIFANDFAGRCFALLVFVSLLWASEAIPLYVTSLSIPFLVVVLRILPSPRDPSIPMPPYEAAKEIAHAFWSPTIFLFLGGFTIALALERYSLNKYIATMVLSRVGSNPKIILFSMMFLCAFLSMWISNAAASVLCVSVILPVVENLDASSSYPRIVLLGIALAGNIGGMTTPIASAQNAIAVTILNGLDQPLSLNFFNWMAVTLPLCVLLLILTYFVLLFFIPIQEEEIPVIKQEQLTLEFAHYFIIIVILTTICLWLFHGFIQVVIGDIGITALIPVILFFGSGYLTVKDFDQMSWNTLMLVGGGMALGAAINHSSLLNIITSSIASVIDENTHLWLIQLIFTSMMLVVGTFVSHTVSSIIILPIVANIGSAIGHPILLVIACTILCSGAMSLPVSSFPNANSFSIKDEETQRPILTVMDYIKTGVIVSVASLILTQSLYYCEAYYIFHW